MNESQRKEILVFITNEDKNEYKKYSLCADPESIMQDTFNSGDLSWELKWCKDEQASCTSIVVKAQGWKKAVSGKLGLLRDCFMDDSQVSMATDWVTGILDKAESALAEDEKVVFNLNKLVCSLEDNVLKKVDNSFGNAVATLFIHWGGGDDKTIERKERKFTNFLRSTTKHYKYRTNWQVFSVSSLRKKIFDVTAARIEIPNDVRSLRGCFEVSIKFSSLKDILSQYVVARDKIKKERQCISEFLASDVFRSKLRHVVTESRLKWLLKWHLFKNLVEADTPNKAKEIANKILWGKSKDTQKLARAFVVQLFTENVIDAIIDAIRGPVK